MLQSDAAAATVALALFAVLAAAGCATAPSPPTSSVMPAAGGDDDAAAFFEALRGQRLRAVFAALGRPDGVRPVVASSGAYIVAWRRTWAVRDSRSAPDSSACIVQGAVTRAGVVSDILVEGDVGLCARSFRRGS